MSHPQQMARRSVSYDGKKGGKKEEKQTLGIAPPPEMIDDRRKQAEGGFKILDDNSTPIVAAGDLMARNW